MSSSDDTSDFECIEFSVSESFYPEKFKPAVSASKKYRLVGSVVHNDVNTLRKLLNKPSKWYRVTDYNGNNLLHLAILRNRKEAFDYIISLDGFPLGQSNEQGQTALSMSLARPTMRGYFALELLKKGVFVNNLVLLDAVTASCSEIVKALLDREIDPDIQSPDGLTALHLALKKSKTFSVPYNHEIELMLLCYGADLFIEDYKGCSSFEIALESQVICPDSNFLEFFQFLYNYSVDEFTKLKLNMNLLLELAENRHIYFFEVTDHLCQVTVNAKGAQNYCKLFSIDKQYMNILVEKCGFFIISVLLAFRDIKNLMPFTVSADISLENFSSFVEHNLNVDFADFISCLDSNKIFGALILFDLDESTITGLICFLLSYGLNLNELDLHMVYNKYGFCKLFKMLLHVDFKFVNKPSEGCLTYIEKTVLPILFYDITFDLKSHLEIKKEYTLKHVDLLLDYFADSKLKELCKFLNRREALLKTRVLNISYKHSRLVVAAKIKKLPQIPSLLQLTRDAFRKFLINKYEIKTTAQFYTYMNFLTINETYKKIIVFEKNIY